MTIHPQTAFFIVGLLYIALPATAWTILHTRHDRTSVALWCLGGLLFGVGFLLVGMRGAIPNWLSFSLANPLSFATYPLRLAALRRELGRRGGAPGLAAAWAVASLAYLAAYHLSDQEAVRLLVTLLVNVAGSAWLAWLAWSLQRRTGFRSCAMLAGAYALFAVALVVRAVAVVAAPDEARALSSTPDFALTLLFSLIAVLYGNLGYIGLALEVTRRQDLEHASQFGREHERRLQTERRIQEQSALLEERGRLLEQRDEMLTALAHEVRQPLNNAAAAMQSASHALALSNTFASAGQRLDRASALLSDVMAAVDNTLADAVLLSDEQPAAREDIDVDTLIHLVLGELDAAARMRVRYERATAIRTASMNLGLMRLALRNLVVNALAYSPAGSPVTLRVSDSDEPLALIFEVCDVGSGIPADLRPRLFTRSARGSNAVGRSGHGLGLHIVQRVARKHGGSIEARTNAPQGVVMRLVISQEQP